MNPVKTGNRAISVQTKVSVRSTRIPATTSTEAPRSPVKDFRRGVPGIKRDLFRGEAKDVHVLAMPPLAEKAGTDFWSEA